jgi:uncharacterized protein
MIWLLDGNVLVALTIRTHVHHASAHRWMAKSAKRFATCSVTQGTLLRLHMTMSVDKSAAAAWRTLGKIDALSYHEFWNDGLSYTEVPHRHLQGPKQVTDAWLAALARRKNARLATFDSALAALHADVAECLPI